MLGWNLGLALVWCALVGELTIPNLMIGFILGYALIGWLIPTPDARAHLRRLPLLLGFAMFYAVELIAATARVAWHSVTPSVHRRLGIIRVPLDVTGDAEIALLVNAVTFTPGTVALDLSADGRTMIVHDMFLESPDAARHRIKHKYERWVRRLFE